MKKLNPRREIIRKRMDSLKGRGSLRVPKVELPRTPGGRKSYVVPFTPDGARRYNQGRIKIV